MKSARKARASLVLPAREVRIRVRARDKKVGIEARCRRNTGSPLILGPRHGVLSVHCQRSMQGASTVPMLGDGEPALSLKVLQLSVQRFSFDAEDASRRRLVALNGLEHV